MQSPFKTVVALASVACAASLLPTQYAWAVPYGVLLESNLDRTANEIYLANYDNYADLLNNVLAGSSAYSDLNVSSVFGVGGYTRNEFGGYSVLLESNADRTSNEIYIANYSSYADLLSNTLVSNSAYSALNVSSAFSVGGLTYDGKGYAVLLESNADRTANEIYLAYYDSFANLLTNTLGAASAYSSLNVSSAFNVGGFTYEGGGRYSVLLESVLDRVNHEIYIASYASWSDLLSNALSSTSAYSDLNVSSAFGVGGFAADVEFTGDGSDFPGDGRGDGGGSGGNPDDNTGDGGDPGGTPVSEPSTFSLFGVAAAGLALITRRRRSRQPNR